MSQKILPFQYQAEKNDSGLTGFAGLPLYLELAVRSGLTNCIKKTLNTKQRGWSDCDIIMSLILLNIAGGDCISDIERLENDPGLRTLLLKFATCGMKRKQRRKYARRWRKLKVRGLPSNAAIHRYLPTFHSSEEENKRVDGTAFIPAPNKYLELLQSLNQSLISYIDKQSPQTNATLDQDATLAKCYKHNAYYCYKKYKAYQPFNTYWAEHGMILHSEFRDGNVPAGYQQLRLLKDSSALLPANITKIFLRSDSAGYQKDILEYCAEGKNKRFGVIEFAIAAKVNSSFKSAVSQIKDKDWQQISFIDKDGNQIQTEQEWAEICYVPTWVGYSKLQPDYRYLAIREKMQPSNNKTVEELDLPFQTIEVEKTAYKLFAIVTNRKLPGNELIQWHRERCGKSEQAHSIQKQGLAGGQLPSNLFGVNAAWWQIMILSFNLNRLMQLVALPSGLKDRQMKALRFNVINLPGRIIYHARRLIVSVENKTYELYTDIRQRIINLPNANPLFDSS